MRIERFKIENFRNIRLAECENPPHFMVVCGGNGCGKSALLQALMTAKEHAGSYGSFQQDPRAVSADAAKARISMTLSFSDVDQEFVNSRSWGGPCPREDEIVVEIEKGGRAKAVKRSAPVHNLLGWYSRQFLDPPGFFDFIDAYRRMPQRQVSAWNTEYLSDERTKKTLGAQGSEKFQFTKEYLASLAMGDLQTIQQSQHDATPLFPDSLKPIRDFFNKFFAPMQFREVRIYTSPFQYVIDTPRGEIDIDDLSGGEKEILNIVIRFHQLKPKGSVILFDEADAHLHPDLERRYLEVLRTFSEHNQMWLTTHSPEMMIAAGTDALFTVLKEPPTGGGNQFVRVSNTDTLHDALAEVMGSRGLVSFNQRVVFIEGDESSADREVYERLYPPGSHNVSFVPVGNSATVRKTAERVNELLAATMPFQGFFSIVDGDIDRSTPAPPGNRLFKLPVYHVENFLLNDELIFLVTRDFLASQCPYGSPEEVRSELERIVVSDGHVKPYARALLDARIAAMAKAAHDAVYQGTVGPSTEPPRPAYPQAESDSRAMMQSAISDGTWRSKCKARDVLKAYCSGINVKYENLRNCLIAKMQAPPPPLAEIMSEILGRKNGDKENHQK